MEGDGSSSTELLETHGRTNHTLVRQILLRVTSGPDVGKRFASRGARAVIGTLESSDFRLSDGATSRLHCEVLVDEGRARIRDLGSRNGTFVNGVPIVDAFLPDGAIVEVGRTRLQFELGPEHVRVPLSQRNEFGLLAGAAPAMRAAFSLLESAARSDLTVLLQGESGTGKELAAESIHRESSRREGPLVVVDCASIPGNLLESELFGHEKGSFTGASSTRIGAFESADGGTVFLDEIGELSLELQPKLLRVLEQREIQRIGGTNRIPVDIRVVAATNRNLALEVNAHRFRPDLYYRLAVVVVTLPPLRERLEDIPLLVEQLLARLTTADDPRLASLRDPGLLTELGRHSWPGNVRELRNHLERCLALSARAPLALAGSGDDQLLVDPGQPLRVMRDRWTRLLERRYLEALLREHNNNVTAAARAAGVDRIHFHRLLSRSGLR